MFPIDLKTGRSPIFRRARIFIVAALAVIGLTVAVSAQRFFGGEGGREPEVHNIPYDGRFTFARARFTTGPGGWYYRGLPAWAHGYPTAEENLMKIMNELSNFRPHIGEDNAFALDDPELCRYPILYMTEAGYWSMTDEDAKGLRVLAQGRFRDLRRLTSETIFEAPDGRSSKTTCAGCCPKPTSSTWTRNIRSSTRSLKSTPSTSSRSTADRGQPILRGIFEDNNPSKRLLAIINFNTDVANFWEFSATGFRPIDESNQAYKLGVNYIIYGLTH